MKKIIHNHFISSFLLTIFFLVHGYTEYSEFIGWMNTLILAFFYLIIVLISYQIWRRFFTDSRKASLLNVALFSVFFFFSAIHSFLKHTFPDQFISKYSFLLPAIAVSILLFFYLSEKIKNNIGSYFPIHQFMSDCIYYLGFCRIRIISHSLR